MKKDYLPVTAIEAMLSPQDFQLCLWSGRQAAAKIQPVEDRAEFRLVWPYLWRLREGASVLDIGCGRGEWVNYLSTCGFRAEGIDTIASPSWYGAHGRFHQQEFCACNLPAESFDVCTAWGVFEHFEAGPAGALSKTRELLKPGGLLVLSVPFQNGRHLRRVKHLWQYDEAFNREVGYRQPMRFYQWRFTAVELARELEIAGFRVLELKSFNKWQGLFRMVKHDLGIAPERRRLHRAAMLLLWPFIPKSYVAHSLFAAARKR